MVLVGMAADHGFQRFNAHLLQVGYHQLAVVHIAAVDDHEFSVAFQQCAVCLTHVDKVDGHAVAGNGGQDLRGFRCFRRFLREENAHQGHNDNSGDG